MDLKKISAVVACAAVCVSLAGCGKDGSSAGSVAPAASAPAVSAASEKTPAEKTAALRAELTLPEMVDVKPDSLEVYGIDKEDVKEFSLIICGSAAMPDEFGVFVAKDADAASRIAEQLNRRMDQQYKTFKDYTPNEMYKFDDSFVSANGSIVSYAICENNSLAKELLG